MELKGYVIKDNEEKEIIINYTTYDIINFVLYLCTVLYLFYLFII
jgi:hypothetical protein